MVVKYFLNEKMFIHLYFKIKISMKMTVPHPKSLLNPCEKFTKPASIIKAIAHPKRLAIIEFLHINGRACVTDIVETLHCEQSCISHHLVDLKLRGILNCAREGQQIYYWLRFPDIVELLDCVETFDIKPV